MLKRIALGVFAVAALSCASFAQDHPNFAGTWKLNSAKSNPGDYGPSAQTDVITQDVDKLTIKVSASTQMGDSNYTLTLTADGNKQTIAPNSPQANMGALTLKDVTASWTGPSLTIVANSSFQEQMDIAGKDVYSLSADGKTMTIASHASTGMGDIDTTLVFDKQ
jgi:hypothetical protein